nr:hypothetical protein [uncultured Psychroserpens sp.]
MKNLQFIFILALSIMMLSCDKDDSNDNPPLEGTEFQATINGGTFSNYSFIIGVYEITKGTNGNTLSIDIGDVNGEQITLFLNGTDGFNSGTVKQMGNIDSNNFVTYALIRQQEPEISYFSSVGTVTITKNIAHPSEVGRRLISGSFNITAASIDDSNELSLTGSFTELEYTE